MDNQMIVKRVDALLSQRSTIEHHWTDIDRYILPLRQGEFARRYDSESSKIWTTVDVWDSTAPIGVDRLASMLHASLLTGRWFGIEFDNPALNKDPEVQKIIDVNVDRMHAALEASNFSLEAATLLLDVVGYGNGALTHEVANELRWQGMDFKCNPIREFLFEEDFQGRPYRAYRRIMWKPSQIISRFRDPKDSSKPSPLIPEKILQLDATGSAQDSPQEVLFAIYPREGKKPLGANEKMRAPMERPFGWKYILREGPVTLEEGGFNDFTAYYGRWAVAADSKFGYGPSLLMLPEVKLVNALKEVHVNAGAKAVDPVTIVTERGLLSDLDQTPGGLVTVRSLDDIDVLESKGRFDVSENMLNDSRMMIRKHLREDDIGLRDSPAMTATEVNRRFVLMNRLFSPQNKRLQFDVWGPMIQNTYNMMYRADQLEPWPKQLLEKAPGTRIVFKGPLVSSMRDDETANIERILTAKAAMLKMNPGSPVKHVIKDDQALREMSERLGIPAAMIASEKEVTEAVKKEQAMAEAAARAEIAKTSAEAGRAAAGADEMRNEMEAED
jgi:hypothetical protein